MADSATSRSTPGTRTTGIAGRRARLERYTTWSKPDIAEFERSLLLQRTIDRELWD